MSDQPAQPTHDCMRRRALREAACCMLVGLVLTYVVSWAVFLIPYNWGPDRSPPYSAFGRPAEADAEPHTTHSRKTGTNATAWFMDNGDLHFSLRTGFPMRTLGYTYTARPDPINRWVPYKSFGAIPIPRLRQGGMGPENRLPLLPLWPGFPLDLALFAIFAWLILFGPLALRRTWRARRGKCPKCGYDLHGLHQCPECGRSR
jgi:hypothetical protein